MATYEELKKKYPGMDDRFLRNHATALKNRNAKDRKFEGTVSRALEGAKGAMAKKMRKPRRSEDEMRHSRLMKMKNIVPALGNNNNRTK